MQPGEEWLKSVALESASHIPPEDRQARLSGSGAARKCQKTIENCFSLSVTEPQRDPGADIFAKGEIPLYDAYCVHF